MNKPNDREPLFGNAAQLRYLYCIGQTYCFKSLEEQGVDLRGALLDVHQRKEISKHS